MSARSGLSRSEPWRRTSASQWALPPRQSGHAAALPYGAAASHFTAVSSLASSGTKRAAFFGAWAKPNPVETPSEVVRGHLQRCLVATTAKPANAGMPKDPTRLGPKPANVAPTIKVQRLRQVASEYKCCPVPDRRRPGSKIAGAEPRFPVRCLATRTVANLPRLNSILMLTLLPNPSVKRTSNGLGPLQGQWLLFFRGPKPLASAYLKR